MSPVKWQERKTAPIPGTEGRLTAARQRSGEIPTGESRDFRLGKRGADYLTLTVHGGGHVFIKDREGRELFSTPLPEGEDREFSDQSSHPPLTVLALRYHPSTDEEITRSKLSAADMTGIQAARDRRRALSTDRDPFED